MKVECCRYTGYVKGLQEVYGKTPVMAQVRCTIYMRNA
jgi:hypothetical protein